MIPFILWLQRTYLHFFQSRFFFEFLILGMLTALIMFPIYGIQAVLLFTIPRLVYLLDTPVPWVRLVLRIWGFGFGFFCISLYWISHALFVELDVFWWLIPFCFLGIPAFLSLFMAVLSLWFLGWSYETPSKILRVIFLQFGYTNTRSVGRLVMVALWWVSGEYFLTDFCTGFPWALVGYTWSPVLVVAQLASLGSVYTLSFLTLCIAGLPYLYFSQFLSRFTTFYTKLMILVALGILVFGTVRLWNKTEQTNIKVRLVQPAIEQTPVWDLEEQKENLNKLLGLSQSKSSEVNIVIWPEAALGFYLEGKALQTRLAQGAPAGGHLILGAVRRSISEEKNWNSIYILNDKGEPLSAYDKHHLVPFGEYVPLRLWLTKIFPKDKIRKITSGLLDFSEGEGPKTFYLSGVPSFSPVICYEAIFPGQITPPQDRPEWLLHLTNDAWFGKSFGPYQHFQIARMRAIEEGLPLVRVSNSGISGVIDPYGRIVAKIGLGEVGTIDATLPKSLPTPPLCRSFFLIMNWFDRFDPFSSRKW